jgi:predicted AAA+ superfamily ATPase
MQGKNKPLFRYSSEPIRKAIKEGKSFLMLGPRQVGKTTILLEALQGISPVLSFLLQDPSVKLDLERDPQRLIREVRAINGHVTVFIDEAQKIPELFDAAQVLIDEKKASFFFTGSSARKLRRKGSNLLPGRIRLLTLEPLLWGELGLLAKGSAPISELALQNINQTSITLENTMLFGNLPGILSTSTDDAVDLLQAYAHLYIEEEIRAEGLSRSIGPFSRFLELAALESGTAPNTTKLSKESGVSVPTIKQYFSVLEDTMIVERVDAFVKNARKRVLSSSRYYFFDMGVRNALARLPLVPQILNIQKGVLFEHAVMLELIRRIRLMKTNHKVYYWRTSSGAEVDCVIETHDELIPIEIKSSANISSSDLTGLRSFISDYGKKVKKAFVVNMGKRPEKIDEKISVIPWQYL